MRPYVSDRQILVNVAKGIEETKLMTLSEQIEEEIPQADVAVLSGPSHAEEVGKGLPTTCVVGAKAALITRGIAEIARLGVRMGGKIETFTGLTGIGDLIVTCASVHSRNRRAGYLIGQGRTMQEAMDEVKMVVEGVYSAKAAKRLALQYQVSMPIVEQVNAVLFEGKSAAEAVKELMLRDRKDEHGALPWDNEVSDTK